MTFNFKICQATFEEHANFPRKTIPTEKCQPRQKPLDFVGAGSYVLAADPQAAGGNPAVAEALENNGQSAYGKIKRKELIPQQIKLPLGNFHFSEKILVKGNNKNIIHGKEN